MVNARLHTRKHEIIEQSLTEISHCLRMSRGVQLSLFGSLAAAVLIAVAGCSHYFYGGEREAWRHDAEVACVNSGAVKDGPERVRISAISGPGICGADFPIQISALGEARRSATTMSRCVRRARFPIARCQDIGRWCSRTPCRRRKPHPCRVDLYRPVRLSAPRCSQPPRNPAGRCPFTLPACRNPARTTPPSSRHRHSPMMAGPGHVCPHPSLRPALPPPIYTPRAQPGPPGAEEHVPLGWPRDPTVTASVGPVEVKPTATLACPIVSALDQWITTAVQPAALHWFRQPVVEIKQISAYSCRGMNGNPNAHISEHAFGNALDIAEFVLADGHKITRAIWLARRARGAGISARRAARRLPDSPPCWRQARTSTTTITFTLI